MEAVVNVVGAVVIFLVILAAVLFLTVPCDPVEFQRARTVQELEGVDRLRREQVHRAREIGRRYRHQLDELQ
jgi:hypothetical protein